MQTHHRMLVLGAVLLAVSVVGLWAQGVDPVIGTWELNIPKSQFSSGPAPKAQTRTYEAAGQGLKYTQKGVDAQGKPALVQFTANFDGKDYPMSGSVDSDAIALKRIDAYTTEITQKKAGKVVITGTRVVSKDGKTMTITSKGTNAAGQTINNVLIFAKR